MQEASAYDEPAGGERVGVGRERIGGRVERHGCPVGTEYSYIVGKGIATVRSSNREYAQRVER